MMISGKNNSANRNYDEDNDNDNGSDKSKMIIYQSYEQLYLEWW